jgi:hypothetical protein
MSSDAWASVLRLSTKWHFQEFREVASKQLKNMPMAPVDRIVLAKECFVAGQLRSGYLDLATGRERLTAPETERIGWRSALCVMGVREEAIRLVATKSYGYVRDEELLPIDTVRPILERVFEEELQEVEKMNQALFPQKVFDYF